MAFKSYCNLTPMNIVLLDLFFFSPEYAFIGCLRYTFEIVLTIMHDGCIMHGRTCLDNQVTQTL